MAILTKNDFKQMNEIQLNEKLSDLRKELMKINTQISTGTTPENPGRVREVKKTIARILTALNLRKNAQKGEEKVEKKGEEKVEKKTVKKTKEENKKQ
ncbi:MAG: 50S ribosomal protein L29 [Nanoarchaeota archaeon]|nr:50S ribosomal protein L29 [Nanoarchaeota archaeon]